MAGRHKPREVRREVGAISNRLKLSHADCGGEHTCCLLCFSGAGSFYQKGLQSGPYFLKFILIPQGDGQGESIFFKSRGMGHRHGGRKVQAIHETPKRLLGFGETGLEHSTQPGHEVGALPRQIGLGGVQNVIDLGVVEQFENRAVVAGCQFPAGGYQFALLADTEFEGCDEAMEQEPVVR